MIDIYDHHAISAGEIRIARDRALAALGRLDGTVAGLGGDALAIFAQARPATRTPHGAHTTRPLPWA